MSYSQQSTADPSVTFFKLVDHDSFPDSDPESGLGPSPVRHSKCVTIEIINTEGTASCGGDDETLPVLATKAPMGKGKGKAATQPPARTPSSESAASPKKPNAIKQALEKPHLAPVHWPETYDAIEEMCSQFPAPVDAISCDTAKSKEMGPGVRDAYRIPNLSTDLLLPLNALYCLPSSLLFRFWREQNKRSATLISLVLSSQTKDGVTVTAVDKLRAALGGTLSLDALLAAEEQVIADAINKAGFWRRKTQFVPTPPFRPPQI